MKKKQYTQPSLKAFEVKPSAMICGSGDNNSKMDGGANGGGSAPEADPSGVVTGDAKSGGNLFDW